MHMPALSDNLLSLSSRDMPAAERLPFWREVFGRRIAHVDIEPAPDMPFGVEATMRVLPGLRLHAASTLSPIRFSRTREILADGNDDFALLTNMRGIMTARYGGEDIPMRVGEAVLFSHAEPSTMAHGTSAMRGLIIERRKLAPLVCDLDNRTARPIAPDNEALRLLHHYLDSPALDGLAAAPPELRQAFALHVCDLVALALGATRDGAALALARGGRAARLEAVKADILGRLREGDLCVATVAERHHMTARHVHRLFEGAGTTFSHFVLKARLERAHRMLSDPRHAHLPITELAYAAGFGDLSYFNRAFRRHYGGSPTEIRRAAARPIS